MTTNANATITCTIDGHEVSGTIDVILSIISNRTPDQTPTPKPAPKADPKPKAAPKAAPKTAPKAETVAPEGDDPWYLGIVTSPWVKEYVDSPKSSIVKVRPEAGHGPELRTAGFRTTKNPQWWWAYKDADKARKFGEKYLANRAAREQAKTA